MRGIEEVFWRECVIHFSHFLHIFCLRFNESAVKLPEPQFARELHEFVLNTCRITHWMTHKSKSYKRPSKIL